MATGRRLAGVKTRNVKVQQAELSHYAFTGLAGVELAWVTYLLTLSPKPWQVAAALWVFGFSLAGLGGCLLVFKSGKFRATHEGYWWFRIAHLIGVRGFATGALFALWPFIGLVPAAVLSASAVVALAFFFRHVAPRDEPKRRRRKLSS